MFLCPHNAITINGIACRGGGMVDTADLKSAALKSVWVRLPPSAPKQKGGTMKTVTCPRCGKTNVHVFIPTPSQKKLGYVKTGSCEELGCGYIYEIHENKPSAEFTRYGALATTVDVRDLTIKALRENDQKEESDIIKNIYNEDKYDSYDGFVELCRAYVNLVEY